MKKIPFGMIFAIALFAFLFYVPQLPLSDWKIPKNIITELMIVAILALGLNVIIGYTGLLHLGIAGFYGIGAVTAGILITETFPLQQSFLVTIVLSTIITALVCVGLSAAVLRLRGDYFALVTLGFGEIVVTVLKEFEFITGGKKTLQNLRPKMFPEFLSSLEEGLGKWRGFPDYYYICLGLLLLIFLGLRNFERSRTGRGLVAIREDELAAGAMGLNPAKLKFIALAMGAGIVGLAGALFTVHNSNTTEPQVSFSFNVSIIILASVILGGIGNKTGVLIGVFLLLGYDKIGTRILDAEIQDYIKGIEKEQWFIDLQSKNFYQWFLNHIGDPLKFKLSSWRLMIFGVVLILMMRFRPKGIIPEKRN